MAFTAVRFFIARQGQFVFPRVTRPAKTIQNNLDSDCFAFFDCPAIGITQGVGRMTGVTHETWNPNCQRHLPDLCSPETVAGARQKLLARIAELEAGVERLNAAAAED